MKAEVERWVCACVFEFAQRCQKRSSLSGITLAVRIFDSGPTRVQSNARQAVGRAVASFVCVFAESDASPFGLMDKASDF